jgi:hypothetical protein
VHLFSSLLTNGMHRNSPTALALALLLLQVRTRAAVCGLHDLAIAIADAAAVFLLLLCTIQEHIMFTAWTQTASCCCVYQYKMIKCADFNGAAAAAGPHHAAKH